MLQNGACYIRVSTDDQLEFSPDAQLKLIKRYAKEHDIIITAEHVYIDEGISGKRADKRPQFMKMIATAKTKPKPFDVILVHKFDRFARSREDSVVYKSLLKREAGIKVISITESIEDDKFSVILEAMLEAMAEYYSLNLADEVKKGMTDKAERGEFQSVPPFGYRMENKQLVPIEEEANFIRFIFENFSNRKMTMRQLALYANHMGIKTHMGNEFETRSIDYIINNPVYIGKVRWTPTGRTRRNFHNPDTIIRDSTHEPLISEELWEKTQEVIKENKELFRPREKITNQKRTWLSGLVKCSNCGKTLVVQSKQYMQCNGYVKGKCNVSCHVKISTLEELVLEKLEKTYQDKIDINIVPKTSDNTSKAEHDLLTETLSKLDMKEQRIKEAYQDGIDTLEEYKNNKNRIASERKRLIEELENLKNELLKVDNEDENIMNRINNVYEILTDDSIDVETKYRTAHFLIEKVVYSRQDKVMKIVYK